MIEPNATSKRRIRFTKAELDAIISMSAIAGAMPGPEGDYGDWTNATFDAAATAAAKAHGLLRRARREKGTETRTGKRRAA